MFQSCDTFYFILKRNKTCIKGAWSARANNVDQWIMVELDSIYTITDIATQGMCKNFCVKRLLTFVFLYIYFWNVDKFAKNTTKYDDF